MSDAEEDAAPEADAEDAASDGRGSPSLASHASSAPPAPHPQQLGAQQLSNHPVWQAARGSNEGGGVSRAAAPVGGKGKGGGRGGGRGSRAASEAGDPLGAPRFERISMAELEAKQWADGDGADSRIDSDDDGPGGNDDFNRIRPMRGSEGRNTKNKKKKRTNGPRQEGAGPPDDPSSDDDDEEESDGDDDRRRKLSGLMGAAAFGGGGHYGRGGSEAGSQSEISSSRRREAMRDAFPVRGVSCVGCALANRIGPVNRFVRDNISLMTEDTLWKMASLCYKREVAEPTEREGAPVPAWSWKEVRVHYELHATGNFVARHKMIRELQSMRQQQAQRLVRVDNGEKELDRMGADLMLKVRRTANSLSLFFPFNPLANRPVFRRSWPQSPRSGSSSRRSRAARAASATRRAEAARQVGVRQRVRRVGWGAAHKPFLIRNQT